MIEWKEKIEQAKASDEKISADGDYELQIFIEDKSRLPYFFISKKLQHLLLGYGHGKTELEAMKNCVKSTEFGIKCINESINKLREIIIEMEKAEHPLMSISNDQPATQLPPELSLTDEQIRSGEFQ